MTRTAAVLCVALLAIGAAVHASGATPAPNVTLVDASGNAVRLSDLAGNVVLIDFWASWCIPCRKSFPEVDALHRELKPRGLEVDGAASNEAGAKIPVGGKLAIAPKLVAFGTVRSGSTPVKSVTLTNTGSGPLAGKVHNLVNPFAAFLGSFGVTQSTGYFVLQPGESATVQIQFSARRGSFTAFINVESSGGAGSAKITGTGK